MHLAVVGQAFDRQDVGAVGLHREHGATLHGLTVEVQAARTARRRVATDVGAGQSEGFAYVMDQQRAWLHFAFVNRAVDGDVNLHDVIPPRNRRPRWRATNHAS